MDTERQVYTTEWLRQELAKAHLVARHDRRLNLSNHLICCPESALMAVGGERSEGEQINAFLDAMHWRQHALGGREVTLVFGGGKYTECVLDALATLKASLKTAVGIDVQVNFNTVQLERPHFTGARVEEWLRQLRGRECMPIPELAVALKERVSHPSFRWYRSLTGQFWSGRVEGLEVCRICLAGERGVLQVGNLGRQGAESAARRRFRELVGEDSIEFKQEDVDIVADHIQSLVHDREKGLLAEEELEHRLESRVLRNDLTLAVPDGLLEPIEPCCPFQFPTLWSGNGRARYVDVLMHAKRLPWVVELKVATAGQGQYLRHAIGQAVLYREFIRTATTLHPWFEQRDLDPNNTQAVVVVPQFGGPQAKELRGHVIFLAEQFGVHTLELPPQ